MFKVKLGWVVMATARAIYAHSFFSHMRAFAWLSSSSSSYVDSSFTSGEPYIVRIEHAFVTQPLTRGYPEISRSNPGKPTGQTLRNSA